MSVGKGAAIWFRPLRFFAGAAHRYRMAAGGKWLDSAGHLPILRAFNPSQDWCAYTQLRFGALLRIGVFVRMHLKTPVNRVFFG